MNWGHWSHSVHIQVPESKCFLTFLTFYFNHSFPSIHSSFFLFPSPLYPCCSFLFLLVKEQDYHGSLQCMSYRNEAWPSCMHYPCPRIKAEQGILTLGIVSKNPAHIVRTDPVWAAFFFLQCVLQHTYWCHPHLW